MPETIAEFKKEKILIKFPDGWLHFIWDDEKSKGFYRNYWQNVGDSKSVDCVAYHPLSKEIWLIELKDNRKFQSQKDLVKEVMQKYRDTLAALFLLLQEHSKGHPQEFKLARFAQEAVIRLVFHYEPDYADPKMRAFSNDLRDEFRKNARFLDPQYLFGSAKKLNKDTKWTLVIGPHPRNN